MAIIWDCDCNCNCLFSFCQLATDTAVRSHLHICFSLFGNVNPLAMDRSATVRYTRIARRIESQYKGKHHTCRLIFRGRCAFPFVKLKSKQTDFPIFIGRILLLVLPYDRYTAWILTRFGEMSMQWSKSGVMFSCRLDRKTYTQTKLQPNWSCLIKYWKL